MRTSALPCLVALLLCSELAGASEWQHDLDLGGSTPGRIREGSLRSNGTGVDLLVVAGHESQDQRVVTLAHGTAMPTWTPAVSPDEISPSTLVG